MFAQEPARIGAAILIECAQINILLHLESLIILHKLAENLFKFVLDLGRFIAHRSLAFSEYFKLVCPIAQASDPGQI